MLSSDLFAWDSWKSAVLNPVDEISGLFFSWEQYFTALLIQITERMENFYSKRNINLCYCLSCCCKKRQNCNMSFTTKKKAAVLGRFITKNVKSTAKKISAFK